ncbi:hypothetical protein XbrCFBP1976_17690, partial [Xanthomonas bromi]
MSHHLPESYSAWRHCIEIDCAQPLTATFIAQRLAALHDPADHHTEPPRVSRRPLGLSHADMADS